MDTGSRREFKIKFPEISPEFHLNGGFKYDFPKETGNKNHST